MMQLTFTVPIRAFLQLGKGTTATGSKEHPFDSVDKCERNSSRHAIGHMHRWPRIDAQLVCSYRVRGCNSQSEIYNLNVSPGVLAQLVNRLNGIEEIMSSNPAGSAPFFWIRAIKHQLFITDS
jgi:hypothetical protein